MEKSMKPQDEVELIAVDSAVKYLSQCGAEYPIDACNALAKLISIASIIISENADFDTALACLDGTKNFIRLLGAHTDGKPS
jgi:hypothetical protein